MSKGNGESDGHDGSFESRIASLGHGDHLCMVYDDREEQMAAAVPFIAGGLAAGDCCVYIADDRTADEVAGALDTAGVDVARERRRGALHLLTKKETYLRAGRFDPRAMIEFLRATVEHACAEGFAGFRVTGEMTWALGDEIGNERLIEYEALLNDFFPGSRALAICQYNRKRFSPAIIHDVLRTHPQAVLGRQICDNLYYEPPELILGGGHEAERVDWMISQLQRREREQAERARIEDSLRRSEQRFARFMENLPGLAWIKDAYGKYVFANDAAVKAFRAPREELYGKTDDEVFPPDTAQQFKRNDRRSWANEEGTQFVETLEQEDGVHHSLVVKFPIPERAEEAPLIGGMAIDVTERMKAEKAVRDSERIYRAIGESIDFGIWICDPEGRNVYVSPSFLRLVGKTQAEISDFGWRDVLHPDDAERTVAAWKECARTLGVWDIEHRFRGVDGKYHPVLARGVPVKDENGAVVCWAGINLDVSRLKEAENALRQADARKDEFLAMLAHELRNPLAPIRTGLDLLALGGADAAIVEPMQQQVTHLVRLVDDLLDVSRIMRGRVELRRERLDLATVVRRAADTIRPLIDARRQTLRLALPERPVALDADPVRLAQIVSNLLHNASKFSDDEGAIDLSAELEGGEAVVRVHDEGCGIDPELQPRVFDLFTQAATTIDRSQGGLGIGLTVVKSLAELHGGSVAAFSEGAGRGSEFVLRIPAAASVAQEPVSANPPETTPDYRILVVDDNQAAAAMLARLLAKLGNHQVAVAHDGLSALEQAQSQAPDIVLLDIGLPKMDGYEVARRLRNLPGSERTLIVTLSGFGAACDREMSLAAGCDDHLVKPTALEAIRQVLRRAKRSRH